MSARGGGILGAVVFTLVCVPALAGPCANEIYQADIAIGKWLDAAAAKGKAGDQSTFATMHRQPTPATIAGAEEQVGDIPAAVVEEVRAFMQAARKADEAGDKAGCEKALAEAKAISGP
jgi:hypothetical protein